jgi:hypothetical protein
MLPVVQPTFEIFVFLIGHIPAIESPRLIPVPPLIGTPSFSSLPQPFG